MPGDRALASRRGTPVREISDAGSVRALAHPLRLSLLETVGLEGPLTATEAAERLGQTPAACSFHLRQLSRYGFVTESARGPGRRRYWQLADHLVRYVGSSWDRTEVAAVADLGAALNARAFERRRRWLAVSGLFPRRWVRAAFFREAIVYLTPDELVQTQAQLDAYLLPYLDRDQADVPPDARPVAVVAFGHPLSTPRRRRDRA